MTARPRTFVVGSAGYAAATRAIVRSVLAECPVPHTDPEKRRSALARTARTNSQAQPVRKT